VRRVRRDLSDKTIRKVVKQSLKSDQRKPKNNWASFYLRPALYVILLIFVLFIFFKFLSSVDFNQFFTSATVNSQVTETQPENPALERQTPPKERNTPAAATEKQEKPEKLQPVAQKLQIEILNGCGVNGIARRATNFSRNHDLDVVSMGNYRKENRDYFKVQETQVIGWIEDRHAIEKIAGIFGISKSNISMKKDRNKQLAASVVLGADYKKLKPFKN